MYLAFILLQQISGLYVNDAYELCETVGFFPCITL